MVIKIDDLDRNSHNNMATCQTNETGQTENIRELTDREQKISGGGTGTFSLTVTDEDGKKVIDEKTTFKTGSLSLSGDLDILDDESEIKILRPSPIAFFYPSIIGFGYFFGDDDDDDSTESKSNS